MMAQIDKKKIISCFSIVSGATEILTLTHITVNLSDQVQFQTKCQKSLLKKEFG